MDTLYQEYQRKLGSKQGNFGSQYYSKLNNYYAAADIDYASDKSVASQTSSKVQKFDHRQMMFDGVISTNT